MIYRIALLAGILCLLGWSQGFAQSSRDPGSIVVPQKTQAVSKKKTKKKKRLSQQLDNSVEEYNKLMKQNARKYARIEKGMKKPQYSDPTYFGHKRPPKKRPLGKRKMCKECGIVH